MAYDKIVDSAKLDGAMTATADAIRGKTGKTADIPWNESTGFASEIASIPTETEPNLQEKTATPSTSSQTIKPDSGYDGLSQVTVNAMPTATQATPSIAVTTGGLITAAATQTAGYVAAGTKSATKQLTTQAAKTITPSTADQNAVASGVYTTGAVTVKGDANLKAENIAKGASIFGITGTHAGGGNVAVGSVTVASANGSITVSGLGFKPTNIMLYYDVYANGETDSTYWKIIDNADYVGTIMALQYGDYKSVVVAGYDSTYRTGHLLGSNTLNYTTGAAVTTTSSGFVVSGKTAAGTYRYIATA